MGLKELHNQLNAVGFRLVSIPAPTWCVSPGAAERPDLTGANLQRVSVNRVNRPGAGSRGWLGDLVGGPFISLLLDC